MVGSVTEYMVSCWIDIIYKIFLICSLRGGPYTATRSSTEGALPYPGNTHLPPAYQLALQIGIRDSSGFMPSIQRMCTGLNFQLGCKFCILFFVISPHSGTLLWSSSSVRNRPPRPVPETLPFDGFPMRRSRAWQPQNRYECESQRRPLPTR